MPGDGGWLWIVAFTGSSFELGCETQVPVLVRPDERADTHLRVVEWRLSTD